jgi:hypothetical protein
VPLRISAAILAGLCGVLSSQLLAENFEYDRSGNTVLLNLDDGSGPVVIAQPMGGLNSVGGSRGFSVIAAGHAPLMYQWQFNSNNISGATADTLLLTNITLADFGAYRVIVSNAFGSVTSSNALLQLDSDRDGMADSWEITYFTSITNRSGFEDFDADGVSDRDEFLEGTNPKLAGVLNPRLTIISDRGEVFVSPNVPLFTNGQTITLTGVPDPGQQFLAYLGTSSSGGPYYTIRTNPAPLRFGGIGMAGSQTIRAIFGLPIPDSLDVTNAWKIDQAGWYGQTNITHDGVDAAQSARILGAPEAVLELSNVVLSAEGTITFWWKVDGTPADRLVFARNNLPRTGEIGTNTDWQLRTYYLPAGTNVVRWVYRKGSDEVSEYNGLSYAPLDAGWVDQVTYGVWPDPLRDSDADGIPDIWEFRYFDGIDQSPTADYDGDGISNRDEYLDGTNPASNGSYFPRLTVIITGSDGTIARTPNLAKYTLGQRVQLQAIPDAANYFVVWSGAVSGTNTTNSVVMNLNKTITAVFGSPLADALETPALTWTRFGQIGWFGQTNVSHDGVDAAQTGPTDFNQPSGMETSVNGPGTLTFWWKASSRTNSDVARFLIDEVEQPDAISGETEWQIQSYYLTASTHTLRWVYTNGTGSDSITNGAWVDQVSFIAGTIAPTIYDGPANVAALQGSSAFFRVIAGGTPPLYYQWFRNGVSLGAAGANATLTLAGVSAAQAGSYFVQVSNAVQTVTSSTATLTVLPVPPANDSFANRAPLSTANPVTGYTFGATKEPGETNHASLVGGRSVWWSWVAPSSGNFEVVAIATNLNVPLVAAVYRGNSVTALTEVASGISTISTNQTNLARVAINFTAVAGTNYAVVVDHSASSAGFLALSVAPVAGLVLGNVAFSVGGAFGFSFTAPLGAGYVIEGSTDLRTWFEVESGLVPPSGAINYAELLWSTYEQRFYRVLLSP